MNTAVLKERFICNMVHIRFEQVKAGTFSVYKRVICKKCMCMYGHCSCVHMIKHCAVVFSIAFP